MREVDPGLPNGNEETSARAKTEWEQACMHLQHLHLFEFSSLVIF